MNKIKANMDKKPIFVVQKHQASHLHFDFRLEIDGVLKSWAVPKGPSMNPKDKRLAIQVEDHPLDYSTFEGIIAEGSYGAGYVEIWDSGTFENKGKEDLIESINNGLIEFSLQGHNLKGLFALIRTNMDQKSNDWLLIKKRDEYAISTMYNAYDVQSFGNKYSL